MATQKFNLENQDLFKKIIKIVQNYDGSFVLPQDAIETTELIMKEIEKWQEGVSKITPLGASIILNKMKAGKYRDARISKINGSLDCAFSFFLEKLAEDTDREIMKSGENKYARQ